MVSSRLSKKSKVKNVLTFTPPGFRYPIDVPFPERRLPVCERCKKNFKTREFCRSRDGHTGLPWSLTYVCVTLDSTCTGDDGKILEGPFIARPLPTQPYALKGDVDPNTPICAPCKEKNYTRSYCRKKQSHRHLPWSTVYTMLSLAKPGQTPHADMSTTQDISSSTKRAAAPVADYDENGSKSAKRVKNEDGDAVDALEDKPEESDDINNIPMSRTFVAKISIAGTSIHWLDIDTNLISVTDWNDIQSQGTSSGQAYPSGSSLAGFQFQGNQHYPSPSHVMASGNSGFDGSGGYWGGGRVHGFMSQGQQFTNHMNPSISLGSSHAESLQSQRFNHQNPMNWKFQPSMNGRMDAAAAAMIMRDDSGMVGSNAFQMGMFPPGSNFADRSGEHQMYR